MAPTHPPGVGLPAWQIRAFLALVDSRSVHFCWGSYKGPIRRLLRSVGMGGTASPLLWCIRYDPIIAGTASVSGAPCPTYVDDLPPCFALRRKLCALPSTSRGLLGLPASKSPRALAAGCGSLSPRQRSVRIVLASLLR